MAKKNKHHKQQQDKQHSNASYVVKKQERSPSPPPLSPMPILLDPSSLSPSSPPHSSSSIPNERNNSTTLLSLSSHTTASSITIDNPNNNSNNTNASSATLLSRPGLSNLGNTCYMNATLQVLISVKALRKHYLQNDFSLYGPLSRAFHRFTIYMYNAAIMGKSIVSPDDLHKKIGSTISRFNNFRQHDSHELLRELLNGLWDDDNRTWRNQQLTKQKREEEEEQEKQTLVALSDAPMNHTDNNATSKDTEVTNSTVIIDNSATDTDSTLLPPSLSSLISLSSSSSSSSSTTTTVTATASSVTNNTENSTENNSVSTTGNNHKSSDPEKKDTNPSVSDSSVAKKSKPLGPPPRTAVENIFGGKMISVVTCEKCGQRSITEEPFLDLSLPLSAAMEAEAIATAKREEEERKREAAERQKQNQGKGKKGKIKGKHATNNVATNNRDSEYKVTEPSKSTAAESKGSLSGKSTTVVKNEPQKVLRHKFDNPQKINVHILDTGLNREGLERCADIPDNKTWLSREAVTFISDYSSANRLRSIEHNWSKGKSPPTKVFGYPMKKLRDYIFELKEAALAKLQIMEEEEEANQKQFDDKIQECMKNNAEQVQTTTPTTITESTNTITTTVPNDRILSSASLPTVTENTTVAPDTTTINNSGNNKQQDKSINTVPSDPLSIKSQNSIVTPSPIQIPTKEGKDTTQSNNNNGESTNGTINTPSSSSTGILAVDMVNKLITVDRALTEYTTIGRYCFPPSLSTMRLSDALTIHGKVAEIALQHQDSLEALLANFTAPETLRISTGNGYYCDHCNKAEKLRRQEIELKVALALSENKSGIANDSVTADAMTNNCIVPPTEQSTSSSSAPKPSVTDITVETATEIPSTTQEEEDAALAATYYFDEGEDEYVETYIKGLFDSGNEEDETNKDSTTDIPVESNVPPTTKNETEGTETMTDNGTKNLSIADIPSKTSSIKASNSWSKGPPVLPKDNPSTHGTVNPSIPPNNTATKKGSSTTVKGKPTTKVPPSKPTKPTGPPPVLTNAIKRVVLANPPPYLTIHLKRFKTTGRNMLTKISSNIRIPEYLDITPFIAEPLPVETPNDNEKETNLEGNNGSNVIIPLSESESNPLSSSSLNKINRNRISLPGKVLNVYQYRILGVVVHSGSLNGGHYTSYARVGNSLDKEKWLYCNDSSVTHTTLETVLHAQAYIVLYERIDDNNNNKDNTGKHVENIVDTTTLTSTATTVIDTSSNDKITTANGDVQTSVTLDPSDSTILTSCTTSA